VVCILFLIINPQTRPVIVSEKKKGSLGRVHTFLHASKIQNVTGEKPRKAKME